MTLPQPTEPTHVANLASISLLSAQGFAGIDASLEESLFVYGLIWRDLGDGQMLFVHRHSIFAGKFDATCLATDLDPHKEWNWIFFREIYAFTGMFASDWEKQTLANKVFDLVLYHGIQNIFGDTYSEGFSVARS